jgi:polar amino acid transport system permease protein
VNGSTIRAADARSAAAAPQLEFRPHRKWYRRPEVVVPVLVVVAGYVLLIGVDPGSQRYSSQFAPDRDVRIGWDYLFHLVPQMLTGLYILARATVLGFTVAAVLGFFLALGRRSKHRLLRWPVALAIEFVRSTPLLVQLVFLQALVRATPALSLSPVEVLVLGLGIHYGTYASEAYRAGINSVPDGQWEAATALNLGPATTWTRLIIPQAVPNILPALGNNLIAAFKDGPMGGPALGVPCLLFFANWIRSDDFRPVEPYLLIGIGFLMVSIPSAWALRKLEKRIEYERT